MAGVAGPLCVRDRWGGLRFILGLLAGESVASFIVAVIVLALGWLLRLQFGTFGAWEVVAVIVTVLGVADVIGRTPQFRRQVPQHFIHRFSAGRLGIIWGFDLGLLVTTRKSTSLTWIVLLVAAQRPAPLVFATVATSVLVSVAIVWLHARRWRSDNLIRRPVRYRRWFQNITRLVGVASVVAGIMLLPRAL